MNLEQRVILVDDLYLIAVCLHQVGKKRLMQARAEGTLKVVIVDDGHLCVFVSALRTPGSVDSVHHVFADIELFPLDDGFVILRNQKVMCAYSSAADQADRNFVVPRDLTRSPLPYADADFARQAESGADFLFNPAIQSCIGWSTAGLGGTADGKKTCTCKKQSKSQQKMVPLAWGALFDYLMWKSLEN